MILQTEGWRGLYKGVAPSLAKAAPSAAVTFVAYDLAVGCLTPLFVAGARQEKEEEEEEKKKKKKRDTIPVRKLA